MFFLLLLLFFSLQVGQGTASKLMVKFLWLAQTRIEPLDRGQLPNTVGGAVPSGEASFASRIRRGRPWTEKVPSSTCDMLVGREGNIPVADA